MKRVVGIDIGGAKCAVIHGEFDGESFKILQKVIFLTAADYNTPKMAIERMDELLQMYDFEAIGITCNGPIDSKKGIILSPPNLPGWDDIHIKEHFEEKFGVPCTLNNFPNTCAIAEWKLGAGKGMENVVFLTFGTDLEAGIIINDKVYCGANDMAGEIGHIRLGDDNSEKCCGTAESFCSGKGISRLMMEKLNILKNSGKSHPLMNRASTISAFDVFKYANKGDETALEVIKYSSKKFGRLLAVITDILNPEAIIIGSIYSMNKDLVYPIAKQVFVEEAKPRAVDAVKILPAKFCENIGDIGVLAMAL